MLIVTPDARSLPAGLQPEYRLLRFPCRPETTTCRNSEEAQPRALRHRHAAALAPVLLPFLFEPEAFGLLVRKRLFVRQALPFGGAGFLVLAQPFHDFRGYRSAANSHAAAVLLSRTLFESEVPGLFRAV